MYLEFIVTKRNYIRTVSEIEGEWLEQLYPDLYSVENTDLNGETLKALLKHKKNK